MFKRAAAAVRTLQTGTATPAVLRRVRTVMLAAVNTLLVAVSTGVVQPAIFESELNKNAREWEGITGRRMNIPRGSTEHVRLAAVCLLLVQMYAQLLNMRKQRADAMAVKDFQEASMPLSSNHYNARSELMKANGVIAALQDRIRVLKTRIDQLGAHIHNTGAQESALQKELVALEKALTAKDGQVANLTERLLHVAFA